MRILVTGGAGFIGSHLVERLLGAGHEITVLDDLSTGSRNNLQWARGRVDLVVGDVAGASLVQRLIDRVDLVYHLAAAVGVRHIAASPCRAMRTNLRGAECVLDACAGRRIPVVMASSSEVYGGRAAVPFAEDEVLEIGRPDELRAGYTGAKALGECAAFAHARQSGLRVLILRFFNTVGPRQRASFGMVLPSFIERARRGAPLLVHGDGMQTRCFSAVDEVVAASVALTELAHAGRVPWGATYNIGSAEEVSVLDLARRVRARSGGRSSIVHRPFERCQPEFGAGARRRVPDLRRLRQALGRVPSRPLDVIIDRLWRHRETAPHGAGCRGTRPRSVPQPPPIRSG